MSIALHQEDKHTFRLDIAGVLRRSEVARCESELARELIRIGSVRLLCVLNGFEGWESQGAWNDLTFYVRHGDAIDRIAIVGEERWRGLAMMYAVADLRRAPVEFFSEKEMARAREWLAS